MHTIEWAAGLFEGEGCMGTTEGLHYIKVSMTDEDVVNSFADVFDLKVTGPYSYTGAKAHCKPYWQCKSKKQSKVREVISSMLPHFGLRRAHKALNILDDLELATN